MRSAIILCYMLYVPSVLLGEGLPLYYWKPAQSINFGDYLSFELIKRIVGKDIKEYDATSHAKQPKLLGIGSIFSYARDNDVIWGTGVNGTIPLSAYIFNHLDIRAVRGPLTREFLIKNCQIECPEVYGDPTLLLPYFFPEFRRSVTPKYEYLIVPHHSEQYIYPKDRYDNVVYPTDPWDEVMRKILDSKFVIAGAMSGVIVAEAFGIPARILMSPHSTENLFKYQDYYLGTQRPNFRIAYSLEEALRLGGETPPQCDFEKLYDAFPFDLWPDVNFVRPNFRIKKNYDAEK